MKRIISLALALTLVVCMLCMSACGLKKSSISNITKDSSPTRINTLVEYVVGNGEDTLRQVYTTEIDAEGKRAIFTYARDRYALPEEMSETRIIRDKGTVLYDMEKKSSSDDGGKSWAADGVAEEDFALKIEASHFKEYSLSPDGNIATGVLAQKDSKEVLGNEIATKDDSDITVIISTDGRYLQSLDIYYTATSGAKVAVSTSYSYAKITIDATYNGLKAED
ncbi:MAG: hypothetical protein IJY01_06300 [Clostridia bacterium]|nr:hypothetical protein [Clostridia bacterium]MBQ8290458.1 hypothetical protein [Clostridia bacterium]